MKYLNQLFAFVMTLVMIAALANPLFAEKKSIAAAIYPTVVAAGVEAGIARYNKLKEEQESEYNFSESELNNLGYKLLGENRFVAAIKIFELNNQIFPQSPNTFDSLAEANLKAGNRLTAKILYQKVLEVLPDAVLDDNTRKALQRGASSALKSLQRKPAPASHVVRDFTGVSAHPFGKVHPDAPPETKQFGQLAGVWHCINHAYFNGRWVSGWPATWAWKYVLDGFAVQDVWFQREQDFPPVAPKQGRDLTGTNLRMYNPALKKWEMTWFANGRNASSYFTATFENGEIIMIPAFSTVNPKQKSRIIFSNITREHFDWRREVWDAEKSRWRATAKITATRVR